MILIEKSYKTLCNEYDIYYIEGFEYAYTEYYAHQKSTWYFVYSNDKKSYNGFIKCSQNIQIQLNSRLRKKKLERIIMN